MELTRVLLGTEDGRLVTADALLRQDGLWLVPRWLENPVERWRMPRIAIRLPIQDIQPMEGGPARFLLTGSIPTSALQGDPAEAQSLGFEVLVAPEWRLPLPIGGH